MILASAVIPRNFHDLPEKDERCQIIRSRVFAVRQVLSKASTTGYSFHSYILRLSILRLIRYVNLNTEDFDEGVQREHNPSERIEMILRSSIYSTIKCK